MQQSEAAPAAHCSEAGRKMAQPGAALPRRGSSSGAPPAEEAPGPPQPPQSLALPPPGLPPQAQKKKSGFQITSVTPAQASLSANNSIAEDTESYEDLDESLHTEDLSSSELLDASLSRATDLGGPGRSSSEETLSNLQEAESPGALSPNQPRPQQFLALNGTLHPAPGVPHSTARPPAAPSSAPDPVAACTAAGAQPAPSMANIGMLPSLQAALPVGSNGSGAPGPSSAPSAPPASRFRVVKLDSNSEPFKKGRWTCSEFYEREEAAQQRPGPPPPPEERDSTSGSSVSSSLSTLSHYTESVGSGELLQQPLPPQDYSAAGPQSLSALHPQQAGYGQQKPGFQPAATLASAPQTVPVSMATVPSSFPHQLPVTPAATQQPSTVQTLPAVPQLHYAPQQHIAPAQVVPGHAIPVSQSTVSGNVPEYVQHPQILQASKPAVQATSTGLGPSGPPPGTQAQSMQMQSTPVQAQSSVSTSLPAAHPQTSVPATAASGQVVGVGQQLNLPPATHQSHSLNQGLSSVLQQIVPPQSTQILQPTQAGIIQQGAHIGAPGLPQQVVISAQNPPLAAKPQAQVMEPVLQGMSFQQIPAVSPIPPTATVATMNHVSLAASASLSSAPVMSQPSTLHTGSAGQTVTQLPTSLPVAQHMSHQIPLSSAQFFAPSLIQSVANQIADARRLMEHSVAGLPQSIVGEGLSGIGVSSTLDGSGSNLTGPGQLLPLKTSLVDGEDESSSSASVVAIDNKIEQAMDLVKSHLMYAVREEVEVLKEQIKELIEKNSQLEQENSLLKTLASPEQMAQFQAQLQIGSPPASSQPPAPPASGPPGTA